MKLALILAGLAIMLASCSSDSKTAPTSMPCGGDEWPVLREGENTLQTLAVSVRGTNSAGSTSIQVDSRTGFRAGDTILILTMLDTAAATCDVSGVGRAELHYLASDPDATGTGSLELTLPLRHDYVATSTSVHQVVRVPSYNEAVLDAGRSLTAPAWNGTTGGVLALRAQRLVMFNGSRITMDGRGYRGGSSGAADNTSPIYPEGPLGALTATGGGAGGAGALDRCDGDELADGRGMPASPPWLGGGGGNSGGCTEDGALGGVCGGGGGGGAGPLGAANGGRGAASGGMGASGDYVSSITGLCSAATVMDLGGAGGGGCPFGPPLTCSSDEATTRFLLGSGAPAGASGGCSGNAARGAGGPGGTTSGTKPQGCYPGHEDDGITGADGGAGGGLIFLLVDTLVSTDTDGVATISVKGDVGGDGGAGSYLRAGTAGRGFAGGGGGGGADGALGGTIVLATRAIEGPGKLVLALAGGAGGKGGNGGIGTCGGCTPEGCPVIIAGGAGGETPTPGADAYVSTDPAENLNCGGGGGGRDGAPGLPGLLLAASETSALVLEDELGVTRELTGLDLDTFSCPR